MGKNAEQFDDLLKALVPINGLAPRYQKQIMAHARIVDYRKGRYVFKQGDQDNHAIYLLSGELDTYADGRFVKHIVGGTDPARYALAQLQPRQLSARAKTRVSVLRVDKTFLDKLLTVGYEGESRADVEVSEIESHEPVDWMTRMLQSELFKRIPASNIQRIFTLMEPVEVGAGDVVISQGHPGDYYYVIEKGRCEVTRNTPELNKEIKLAELKGGDSFGEEALVAEATRNATVRMLTDGELLRLTKEDFVKLIKGPILQSVTYEQAQDLLVEGTTALDVRLPGEGPEPGLAGSLNVPLNVLRLEVRNLDRAKRYCVYCDTGQRSAVATFLLAERGFDACYIAGGIMGSAAVKTRGAGTDAGEDVEADAGDPQNDRRENALEAAIRASTLKAELATTNLRLEEALRVKAEAENAQREVKKALDARLEAGQMRIREKAEKAEDALQEARWLEGAAQATKRAAETAAERRRKEEQAEVERIRRETERRLKEGKKRLDAASSQGAQEAARLRRMREETEAELERERKAMEAQAAEARRQLEEALWLKSEAKESVRSLAQTAALKLQAEREALAQEAARANAALEEARRLKQEVEAAKKVAEDDLAKRRQEEQHRIRRLHEEAERRLREEERRLEAEYSRNAAELGQVQLEKEQAEARLRKERGRLAAETAEAKRQMKEAHEARQEMERARRTIADEENRHAERLAREQRRREKAQARLAEEKRKLEESFARNAQELESAQREREVAEAARRAAAQEAEKIVAEYKAAHDKLRAKKEAELRKKRRRLQREAARIQEHLDEARHANEAAKTTRKMAELEARRLRSQAEVAGKESPERRRVQAQIRDLEAGVVKARELAVAAEQAHTRAEAEKKVNEAALAKQRAAEAKLRRRLEEDVGHWRHEQDELQKALQENGVLKRQQDYMERIKRRAEAAKKAAKENDTKLLQDVQALLGNRR